MAPVGLVNGFREEDIFKAFALIPPPPHNTHTSKE